MIQAEHQSYSPIGEILPPTHISTWCHAEETEIEDCKEAALSICLIFEFFKHNVIW